MSQETAVANENMISSETKTYLGHQFIGGQWRPGTSTNVLRIHDPYTREEIAAFQMATVDDVDEAYRVAEQAQKSWAATSPQARRTVFERAWQWLDSHAEEVTELLIRESGGTRFKAQIELGLVSEFLRLSARLTSQPIGKIFASPDAEQESRVYYEPVGVVTVISPFNFPLNLSMRAVAPALALGNAVVLKPHELTAITGGTIIAAMFEECGLPSGLLNVVVTDPSEIGDALIEHPTPEVIVFTGSTRTGQHIAEVSSRNFKKSILELGGNSALIVLDDADINLAVDAAIFSRFAHVGQVCMAANRVIVTEAVHDEFLKLFQEKVARLPVGSNRDDRTVIGPLISVRQAEILERQIAEAAAHGAHVALAPKPRAEDSSVLSPVILTNVTTENPVAQQELFGPVVCVMKAKDAADAIRIANATPYGLSGAIHTADLEYGAQLARQIRTGMVHVNAGTIADEVDVPFGGVGASGYGRVNGEALVQDFTRTIWVSVHHGRAHFPYEDLTAKTQAADSIDLESIVPSQSTKDTVHGNENYRAETSPKTTSTH